MKLPVLGMAIVFLVGPAVARAQTLEESVQSLKDAVAKKDVEAVKKLAKDKKISEDEDKLAHVEIQKMTDAYIQKLDLAVKTKEKEIMEIR